MQRVGWYSIGYVENVGIYEYISSLCVSFILQTQSLYTLSLWTYLRLIVMSVLFVLALIFAYKKSWFLSLIVGYLFLTFHVVLYLINFCDRPFSYFLLLYLLLYLCTINHLKKRTETGLLSPHIASFPRKSP